jgi:hypothetical protein
VCTGLDSGKIDTTGDPQSVTATAPEGYRISRYCVKAGAAAAGGGPVYVDVDPPQRTVVIQHPTGKAVSHWSIQYIACDVTPPTEPPTEESPGVTETPDATETPEATESPTESTPDATESPDATETTPDATESPDATDSPDGTETTADGEEPAEEGEQQTTLPSPDGTPTSPGDSGNQDDEGVDRAPSDIPERVCGVAGGLTEDGSGPAPVTGSGGGAPWIVAGVGLLAAAAALATGAWFVGSRRGRAGTL